MAGTQGHAKAGDETVIRIVFVILTFFISWLQPQAQESGEKAQKLSASDFQVCGRKLNLEVARGEKEHAVGMMHRTGVPQGTGMLFVFSEPRELSFWMRNVPFDLDIGYFGKDGKFLNHHTMKGTSPLQTPESLPNYKSEGAAKFAVETKPGFFAALKNRKTCKLSPLPR
jgi:uncharacterized membrane protein (UPF0127 family)